MQRRRFTPEYKQEALQLAQQSDVPISQVAKNLGINDNVLRRWIKEFTDQARSRSLAMEVHETGRWPV
jgi:transposase